MMDRVMESAHIDGGKRPSEVCALGVAGSDMVTTDRQERELVMGGSWVCMAWSLEVDNAERSWE